MASAPPAGEPPKPVDYVFRTCGGNTVTGGAWAEWETTAQDWAFGAVYDYAFCHHCEAETHLEEIDLATREPSEG